MAVFLPESYVAGLSHQVHRVRGTPRDVTRAFSESLPVSVSVVDELHFLRLSRSKERADRKNVENLRARREGMVREARVGLRVKYRPIDLIRDVIIVDFFPGSHLFLGKQNQKNQEIRNFLN